MVKGMLQGYIFDMDGTLLDSMRVWDDVPQKYLASKGLKSKKHIAEVFAHLSFTQTAHYLQDHFAITDDVDTIITEINAFVAHQYKDSILLKEGVYDCIWELHKQGKTLSVLTASDDTLARAALQRCGILQAFSEIMTCETLGASKCETILYDKAIMRMHLNKADCVFIEDSLHAIQTIKKAGYQVYAVYEECNKKDWELICGYSDKAFIHIKEMEI